MPSCVVVDADQSKSNESVANENAKQELYNLTKAVNVINRLALSVTLDINATMESVRSVALELLDCERVTLFLVFERRKELRAQVPDGGSGSNPFIRVKFGEGIAGMTAATGQLLNIPNAYDHPLFSDKHDRETGFNTRSLLSCAIPDSGGKPVAVLQALNKLSSPGGGEQSFNSSDEKNLLLFGAHLGNALAKARLHEQAKREKDRLSAIFNYFKLINTAKDLGEVLGVCTDALQSILHAEHAFVFIMDAPRNELWMQCRPPGQGELLSVRVKVGDGLVGQCGLENAPPINVCDYEGSDELISLVLDPMLRGGRRSNSALVHPVYGKSSGKGKVTAVILALNKRSYYPVIPSSPLKSWKQGGSTQNLAQYASNASSLLPTDKSSPNLNDDEDMKGPDMFFEDYYTEADAEALALIAMEVGDALSARSLECAYASALSVISDVDGIAPGHPMAMITPDVSPFESSVPRLASYHPNSLGQRQALLHADSNPSSTSRQGSFQHDAALDGGENPYNHFLASERGSDTETLDRDSRAGFSHRVHHSGFSGLSQGEEGGLGLGQPQHTAPAATATSSSRQQDAGWKLRSQLMSMYSQSVLTPNMEPTSKAFRTSKTLGRKLGQQRAALVASASQRIILSERGAPPNEARGEGAGGHRSSDSQAQIYPEANGGGGEGVSMTGPLMGLSLDPEESKSSTKPGHTRTGVVSDSGQKQSRKTASGPLPFSDDGVNNHYFKAMGLGVELEDLEEEPEGSGLSSRIESKTHSSKARPLIVFDDGNEPNEPSSRSSPLDPRPLAALPSRTTLSGPGLKISRNVSIHRGAGSVFSLASDRLSPSELKPENAKSEPGLGEFSRNSWPSGSVVDGFTQSIPCFFGREILHSWDYDLTSADVNEMKKVCYDLFMLSGLIDHFKINTKALTNLIEAVASHYRSIPYHNFNHIAHVLHSTWMMLQAPTAQLLLRKEDQLALLVAAICHDLDHDGHSNSFHVYTQSELARLYNDASVMENHHCALAFEILRRQECAMLADFDRESWRRMRKTIVAAILSTDMSNHTHVTQEFRKHDIVFDPECEADRMLLVNVMLHAADIGNAVRPFPINDIMSKRVHREFQVLAAEEEKLGVPITFSIDSNNALMCAQMEVNFLDYVVFPLWERLTEVMPELKPALDNLISNRKSYHKLAHDAAEAAAALKGNPR